MVYQNAIETNFSHEMMTPVHIILNTAKMAQDEMNELNSKEFDNQK